uniref:Bromo domain-containing protein n=1 Tax=Steinernema glaseri TaxID=37863 RepID=A0A1I8ATP0_9BILA
MEREVPEFVRRLGLRANPYRHVRHFLDHLRIVTENALDMHSDPKDPVHEAATLLRDFFEASISKGRLPVDRNEAMKALKTTKTKKRYPVKKKSSQPPSNAYLTVPQNQRSSP